MPLRRGGKRARNSPWRDKRPPSALPRLYLNALTSIVATAAAMLVVAIVPSEAGVSLRPSQWSSVSAAGVGEAGPRQDAEFHVFVPLAPNGSGRAPAPTHTAEPSATPSPQGAGPTITPPPATETRAPPSATPSATAVPGPAWLAYVNRYRSAAGLAPVPELRELSEGAVLHSRYMVKTGLVDHIEDPSSQWYTEAGAKAGRNGNIYVSGRANVGHQPPIDMWMAGPFHMLGIIDPRLGETGYGDYSEDVGRWHFGATIDVLSSRGASLDGVEFPVLYPGRDKQVWNLSYLGNETPNPLTSCPGYSAPSGPPLAIQLGPGNVTPSYGGSRLVLDGQLLDHCVFDQTSYVNPDRRYQDLGRGILGMRSAVVVMPKSPLLPGQTYEVEIDTGGATLSWRFTTSSSGLRAAPPGVIR